VTAVPDLIEVAAERSDFSGVVAVHRPHEQPYCASFGLADRAFGIANTPTTRFAMASGTKTLTAVLILALIEQGALSGDTQVRDLLGTDLPLIDDAVTVDHLLTHRSGIGDYLVEDDDWDPDDYVMPMPVHQLDTAEGYLPALAGHPASFAPDTSFCYCNSGYVVLALVAERATGVPFPDLMSHHVLAPAGMHDTAFDRSDALDGRTARHYLDQEGLRSNVLHLPVRGSGDGGVYSTVADVAAFWSALLADRLISPRSRDLLWEPVSHVPTEAAHYGRGLWVRPATHTVWMEGYDAGVSFRSVLSRAPALIVTVMSNTTEGAWPVSRQLREVLGTG